MARSRIVKPEFFQHAVLYDAEVGSGFPLRVAFLGLWGHADREGRFRWKPRELKLGILPYDPVDFEQVLAVLEVSGFVVGYEVDGVKYGMIPSFKKHQTFHLREAQSVIPPCPIKARPKHRPGSVKPQPRHPASISIPISISASISASKTLGLSAETFEQAWGDYPRRPNNSKAAAKKAWDARMREKCDPRAILAGVRAYAAFVAREGTAPKYIKQAATFFGPGKHWEADYGSDTELVRITDDTGRPTRTLLDALGVKAPA